jgi:inorganic pyrophosphatase
MSEGAAIIIWYYDSNINEPVLLVGKESVYVKDLLENPRFNASFNELIKESEHFDTSQLPSSINEKDKLQAAKDFFSRQSALLESRLGLGRIQFDTPHETDDGFSVNYRYLPQIYKRGIIKGKKEPGDLSPLKTIVREISEELGVNVSEREQSKIQPIYDCDRYQVFTLEIDKNTRNFFLDRIQKRLKSQTGELFEFSFKRITEIDSKYTQYNSKTKCAINKFKEIVLPTIESRLPSGGKSRKTKRRKTKRLKTKSAKNKKV